MVRFFYSGSTKSKTEITKPSQLDFSNSNSLSTATESTTSAPVDQTALPPDGSQILSSIAKLEGQNLATWQTFEDILKKRNDNDPRLDTELKSPSPEIRKALYEKYDLIPSEARNDKGLIVFLIARDFNSPEDAQFLKKVFEEPPCLSLADCKTVGPDDAHHAGVDQTTLNYPQLAGLYQLEKRLETHPEILKDPVQRADVVAILRQAEAYQVPKVQAKASQIRSRFQL